MASQFQNSLFYDLLYGDKPSTKDITPILGGITGSYFPVNTPILNLDIVVFDFETTGLSFEWDRIIEIGAIKYRNQKQVDSFSQLINPQRSLPSYVTKLTGLDDAALKNQPSIAEVLPKLHHFMRGALCVAHNASFDCGMLKHESKRLGIQCLYTVVCTLKMARSFLTLERYNLDTLAKHFELEFISRHRSIGDIMVTAEVFWKILKKENHIKQIKDLEKFIEPA